MEGEGLTGLRGVLVFIYGLQEKSTNRGQGIDTFSRPDKKALGYYYVPRVATEPCIPRLASAPPKIYCESETILFV